MTAPNCQYSNINWIRKDSQNFIALMQGLNTNPVDAVAAFANVIITASRDFQKDFHPEEQSDPEAYMLKLLQTYQDKTGIVSTRHFTLPDAPNDPGNPGSAFLTDLVEGIAGAASTEVGVGISLFNLVLDFIALFNIKLHLKGILMNSSASDLEHIRFNFDYLYGRPDLLPSLNAIPASKSIMNPIDKKNYDCVGFTFFGCVGINSMEGFSLDVQAQIKNRNQISFYAQYFSTLGAGMGAGNLENHSDVRPVIEMENSLGVFVDSHNLMIPNICFVVVR